MIEENGLFWWDRITFALQHSRANELDLSSLGLGSYEFARRPARNRWNDIGKLLSAIQQDAYAEREAVAKHIADNLVPSAEIHANEFATLTVNELRELAASNLITIGSHTHTHDLLTRLTLEEARQTIQRAIDTLESWLGAKVRHFAYPGGDHNAELIELVRSMSIDSAVTIVKRRVEPGSDPMAIPRFSMGGYDTTEEWQANLIGLTDLKVRFMNRG
jgi:hypothetical protein